MIVSFDTNPLRFNTNPSCEICSHELDTEKITQTRHGERHAMASLLDWGQHDGIVITTTMPTPAGNVHLVDTRQLQAGGQAHIQVRPSS